MVRWEWKTALFGSRSFLTQNFAFRLRYLGSHYSNSCRFPRRFSAVSVSIRPLHSGCCFWAPVWRWKWKTALFGSKIFPSSNFAFGLRYLCHRESSPCRFFRRLSAASVSTPRCCAFWFCMALETKNSQIWGVWGSTVSNSRICSGAAHSELRFLRRVKIIGVLCWLQVGLVSSPAFFRDFDRWSGADAGCRSMKVVATF